MLIEEFGAFIALSSSLPCSGALIMLIEEFGAFIALSSSLPCSGVLMNLNAAQYLGCFSVVFVGCFLQQHSVSQLSVNNYFIASDN